MRNPFNQNNVELYYKAKPEDKEWLGPNKCTDRGFAVLSRHPGSGPELLDPADVITCEKYVNEMKHWKFQRNVSLANLGEDALDWCRAVAETGVIPKTHLEDTTEPLAAGRLGRLCHIGVDNHKGTLQVMEPLGSSTEEFWAMPAGVKDFWKRTAVWQPEEYDLNVDYKQKGHANKVRVCVYMGGTQLFLALYVYSLGGFMSGYLA